MRTGRVPNRLIAAGLIAGLVFQITEHRIWGVYFFLRNISVPVILLYLLFQMRVLGAGDIKLFSMTGGILTIGELCRCMAYCFLAAGAGALLLLAAEQSRRQRLACAVRYLLDLVRTGKLRAYEPPEAEGRMPFAFAVFILFGAFAAIFVPIGG